MKIILIETDHQNGVSECIRSDGKVATIATRAIGDSAIAKSRFFPALPFLLLTTARGDDLLFELPSTGDATPLRQRPVVYLDQNTWSAISKARYQPEKVSSDEREAALWLTELVREWKVVVPFSGGTLRETTHWHDDEGRYQLGLTICELSRGWQMLDPLALRAAEMRWILSHHKGSKGHSLPQVWTLASGALQGEQRGSSPGENDSGLGAELRVLHQAVVDTSAIAATFLDKDPIQRHEPEVWTQMWSAFAARVGESMQPGPAMQSAIHAAVITDAQMELAQAASDVGMHPDELTEWLEGQSFSAIKQMPALGLVREIFYLKVADSQAKWKPNDLTDIFYMIQACGYADAVVGERNFVSLARNAQRRLDRPENSFSSLSKLRQSGLLLDPPSRRPDLGG